MATNSLAELILVLAEKVRALESMRETLEEERRLIIEARVDQLNDNTNRALTLISRLNLLSSRFKALLLSAGEELGLSDSVTLSAVIPAADRQKQPELRELQRKCFTAADAINRLLTMNKGLIRNSLEIIDGSLSLFSRLLGGCETYGAAGRLHNGKAQAGIICREI
ncbi:MAG TPA: flagellar protein FlgN [Geobacteraceae bacterium]|nr:flagellar protein FlgN [Geobacteraceae bacterium]